MRSLIPALALLAVVSAKAQHSEFSVHAHTGVSRYSGHSASRTTFAIGNSAGHPAGHRFGHAAGLGLQWQRAGRQGLMGGLALGYENARSGQHIERYYDPVSSSTTSTPARGHTTVVNQFLRVNPFAGYRWRGRRQALDLLLGLEYAPWLSSREHTRFTRLDNGQQVNGSWAQERQPQEFRWSTGLALHLHRWRVQAGYARSLTNYFRGWTGRLEAYAEYVRLGIGYRLNQAG